MAFHDITQIRPTPVHFGGNPIYQHLASPRPPRGTIRVQPAMSPNSNECDGNMLVPLKQFGSASQTEIVLGLLRSSGIPVVHAGEYNPRAPNQILVPAKCIADAYRLIADIGDVAPKSIPTAEQFADEPRPF